MRLRVFFVAISLIIAGAAPFAAHAFSVSPAILELRGNRGETIQSKVSIFNTENREKTYFFRRISFTAKDEQSGVPQFIPVDISESHLANWISFQSNSISVPARTNREALFSVTIPSDISSGGYQAAILVSDAPHEAVSSSGATLQADIAMLVFLTVEGQNFVKADLVDFTSDKGRLALSARGKFSYRVQNQGNVFIQPEGAVVVKDVFGRVLTSTDANPARGRVLAGTTRKFEGQFGAEGNRMWAIGPVTAELTLNYGGEKILKDKIIFWMISPEFLVAILLLIGLEFIRRKLRKKKRKYRSGRYLALALILTGIGFSSSSFAATATSVTDVSSTLQASQASNHLITFTTQTGATAGQIISVLFETGFTVTSITEDDADIADDGTELTTSSSACPAAQVLVARSGNYVNFTLCAGTTIAAGSAVRIKIGTNATSSGTGANQVTNPSTTGTYYVSLTSSDSTFSDSASIALPIGGDDTIAVSATVTGISSQPEGGLKGAIPGDITPSVISGVVVSSVTETSADISWNTDENASGSVDYGTSVAYEKGSISDTSVVTSHTVHLSGLSLGTTHYFQIRSLDFEGNSAVSSGYTFTTLDLTPPVISGIQSMEISDSGVRIIWTTDELTTGVIEYGKTGSYGSAASSALGTSHSVVLTGLSDDTTYHFRVRSTDGFANSTTSSDATFKTAINPPPANVFGFSISSGNKINTLSWSNPSDADLAAVRIRACEGKYPSGPEDTGCAIVYEGLGTSFSHSGLTNGKTYSYAAYTRDTKGQYASGALTQGTPVAPEVPLFCGDLACNNGETSASCPGDCPSPPFVEPPIVPPVIPPVIPPAGDTPVVPPIIPGGQQIGGEAFCGNAVCEFGEDKNSCQSDCPSVIVPFSQKIPVGDVLVFVAKEAITLKPEENTPISILEGKPLSVELSTQHLSTKKQVDRVQLVVGSDTYSLAPNNQSTPTAFRADIVTPSVPTNYMTAVTVFYKDGSSQTLPFISNIKSSGVVLTKTGENVEPVPEAKATLFQQTLSGELVVWDGSSYGEFNPTRTDARGGIKWYVPNGTYVLRVEKDGYKTVQTKPFSVTNQIVNPVVELEVVPPVISVESAGLALENTVQALQGIRESRTAQTATDIAVPAIAVATAASTVSLVAAFNLLPFLQYLFSLPALILGRRKRKGYGVVYNAISKVPVDLATVRLYQVLEQSVQDQALPVTERLVASRVTDRNGRYFFLAQPGKYRIRAMKPGFAFPSDYLKQIKDDRMYLDVYHGEEVVVTESNALITANIPLDPFQAAVTAPPNAIRRKLLLQKIQGVMAWSGLIISGAFAFIRPDILMLSLVEVQIFVFLLSRRLAAPRKAKNWGIVYDKETGRPISQVIARIFEPKYNKVLETAVSDSRGRYSFLLGPNQYYATFEKDGFAKKEVRPIDYTNRQDATEFSERIALEPAPA